MHDPGLAPGRVPGDKSISHRVLLIALTLPEPICIRNCNTGSAVSVLLPVLEALGAHVSQGCDLTTIVPPSTVPRQVDAPLNVGPSSAAARLLIGLLAGLECRAVIDGDQTLRRRPMSWIVEPLRSLGARMSYLGENGCLPIRLEGGAIRDGVVEMTVGSAQASSAIMLAAYAARRAVRIIQRSPARDHTARLLRHLGSPVDDHGDFVEIRGAEPRPLTDYTVPGDPSAAAFLAAANTFSRRPYPLRMSGIGLNPTRLGFFRLLQRCGVSVTYSAERDDAGEPVGDAVVGPWVGELSPFRLDGSAFHAIIDEVPLAAALAALIPGDSEIAGAAELSFKETDRIQTTAAMLHAFGAQVETSAAAIRIFGGRPLHPASPPTFGDHRIAMAAAALACSFPAGSCMVDVACCSTSFPDVRERLMEIGLHGSL